MDALSIKAPKQPYILMRYRIEPFGVVKHVWEVMTRPEPEARGNIPLSEKQARLFIDEHGLVPLSSDDDNAIYGTTDEAFRKKWAGYFAKEKERIRVNYPRMNSWACKTPSV